MTALLPSFKRCVLRSCIWNKFRLDQLLECHWNVFTTYKLPCPIQKTRLFGMNEQIGLVNCAQKQSTFLNGPNFQLQQVSRPKEPVPPLAAGAPVADVVKNKRP